MIKMTVKMNCSVVVDHGVVSTEWISSKLSSVSV